MGSLAARSTPCPPNPQMPRSLRHAPARPTGAALQAQSSACVSAGEHLRWLRLGTSYWMPTPKPASDDWLPVALRDPCSCKGNPQVSPAETGACRASSRRSFSSCTLCPPPASLAPLGSGVCEPSVLSHVLARSVLHQGGPSSEAQRAQRLPGVLHVRGHGDQHLSAQLRFTPVLSLPDCTRLFETLYLAKARQRQHFKADMSPFCSFSYHGNPGSKPRSKRLQSVHFLPGSCEGAASASSPDTSTPTSKYQELAVCCSPFYLCSKAARCLHGHHSSCHSLQNQAAHSFRQRQHACQEVCA